MYIYIHIERLNSYITILEYSWNCLLQHLPNIFQSQSGRSISVKGQRNIACRSSSYPSKLARGMRVKYIKIHFEGRWWFKARVNE